MFPDANEDFFDQSVQLKPGDKMFVFSDGIVEANNKEKIPFDYDNLIKVISRVQLKERELKSVSAMIDRHSHKTAEALRNYQYIPDLF
jgi:serine phosphatase RsbU (regulator of sigma subunit)